MHLCTYIHIYIYTYMYIHKTDAAAESVERSAPTWKMGVSIPDRVKQMAHKIDSCCFLARCFTLIRLDKDWLARGKKKQVMMLMIWSPSGAAL